MISVLTGDIINSRKVEPKIWLNTLKKELNILGTTPATWEIYRGDSFQIEIKEPETAIAFAIQLKVKIKLIKGLDTRLAIGIGDKTYSAKKVTESNGTAFVFSGELVEELKKNKINLAIRSADEQFDKEINLYLKLALITMNHWTANDCETIYAALTNPDKLQQELGETLGIKQNAVSSRLKRSRFEEISELIAMFKHKINNLK